MRLSLGLALIFVSLFPSTTWSWEPDDLADLNRAMAEEELSSAITDPKHEVSGAFFNSLLEGEAALSVGSKEKSCESDKNKKRRKKKTTETHSEVLFVAQLGNPKEGWVLDQTGISFSTNIERLEPMIYDHGLVAPQLDPADLKKWAQDLSSLVHQQSTGFPVLLDPKQEFREFYVEALVRAAANAPSMGEAELAQKMASALNEISGSDEERFQLLNILSSRLYQNYNYARNPGANDSKNNPSGAQLPDGDLSLQQMMMAAATFDRYGGGVCNDISEQVAIVAEKLFPGKDVLTVTGGSHFGVLVHDGKQTRVIDGSNQLRLKNQVALLTEAPVTNARISQVTNGKLKEIAVVDTQMGQVVNNAFGIDRPLLQTDTNISQVLGQAKKIWQASDEKRDQKRKELSLTAAKAQLSDSQVVIAVVKYDKTSSRNHFYSGLGASEQEFSRSGNPSYALHLRSGYERTLFEYVNPKLSVKNMAGISVGGSYATERYEGKDHLSIYGISGGADAHSRLQVKNRPQSADGLLVKGDFQAIYSAGPKNWGGTTGAVSKWDENSFRRLVGDMGFHLNQVNANIVAEKPISRNVTSVSEANYQGSNIGQRVDLTSGFEIKTPEGATVYFFVGVQKSDLQGYRTDHSLLYGPTGVKAGGRLRTKKGIEVNTQVQGLGSDQPFGTAGVSVPVQSAPKKKPRAP